MDIGSYSRQISLLIRGLSISEALVVEKKILRQHCYRTQRATMSDRVSYRLNIHIGVQNTTVKIILFDSISRLFPSFFQKHLAHYVR